MKIKGWIFGIVFLSFLVSQVAFAECVSIDDDDTNQAKETAIRTAITNADTSVCFTYTDSNSHVSLSTELTIEKDITIQNLRISGKGVIINSGEVSIEDSSIQDLGAGIGIKLNGGNLTLKTTNVNTAGTCVDVAGGNLTTIDDSVFENCSLFGINIGSGERHAITDTKISCVLTNSGSAISINDDAEIIIQGNELTGCEYGIKHNVANTEVNLIGALSLDAYETSKNIIHDNKTGLYFYQEGLNVMFAYNSLYGNSSAISINEPILSLQVATNEEGGYLDCIVNEDSHSLVQAFVVVDAESVGDKGYNIQQGDVFVLYSVPSEVDVNQGKEFFHNCQLQDVDEAFFEGVDTGDADSLLGKYSGKLICDIKSNVVYDSIANTCTINKDLIGILYRNSESTVEFTSNYSNHFDLSQGGYIAVVGTLETPTSGVEDTSGDSLTGLDTEGGTDGSGTDDSKKEDSTLDSGAGGEGSAFEGFGMAGKMCSLEPDTHISSKQVSLFGIWWIITLGIVSHFRRQAKKVRKDR